MDYSFPWNHKGEEFRNYYFNNDVKMTSTPKYDDASTTTRTRRVTITEIIDEHENWNSIGEEQVIVY
jgi:ATP-dependent phosphoenolpyruvate carboxykinase